MSEMDELKKQLKNLPTPYYICPIYGVDVEITTEGNSCQIMCNGEYIRKPDIEWALNDSPLAHEGKTFIGQLRDKVSNEEVRKQLYIEDIADNIILQYQRLIDLSRLFEPIKGRHRTHLKMLPYLKSIKADEVIELLENYAAFNHCRIKNPYAFFGDPLSVIECKSVKEKGDKGCWDFTWQV